MGKIIINESATQMLEEFSKQSVPLINLCEPKVLELNRDSCTILLPLNKLTKNHLNSMYFGALAIGADCAGGLIAFSFMQEKRVDVALVFKDFSAQFIKRAEHDVIFRCDDGPQIVAAMIETIQTKKRVHIPVKIIASSKGEQLDLEKIADFSMTLSLKGR
tara:strand:+ start:576 stop:1058 length:483 start_codon:yes stop_codon:yes gene_type:complete